MVKMKQGRKIAISFVVLMTLFFTLLFTWVFVIPGAFLYIEIGKYVGPIIGLILLILIFILILAIPARVLNRFEKSMTKKEFAELIRRKKRQIFELVLISFLISFFVVSAFSFVFISAVSQQGSKIDAFVAQNANESLQDYTGNLTIFLNTNLKSCYNKPEWLYKIDEQVSTNFFDSWIMNVCSVNRAEVILYQGWGACGQAAILLQQVMHDSGYETRLAHFKGVDHSGQK
jgi:hypothetical protein